MTSQQFDLNTIFPYIMGIAMLVIVWRLVSKELEPAKAPKAIEEPVIDRKAELEAKGEEIASLAGVEFVALEEGWQVPYSVVRYWFRDEKGRMIIARDLDELEGKLRALRRRI